QTAMSLVNGARKISLRHSQLRPSCTLDAAQSLLGEGGRSVCAGLRRVNGRIRSIYVRLRDLREGPTSVRPSAPPWAHLYIRRVDAYNPRMAWFRRNKGDLESPVQANAEVKTVKTEGLFVKCPGCDRTFFKRDFEAHLNVCPECGYHMRIGAKERLGHRFDA